MPFLASAPVVPDSGTFAPGTLLPGPRGSLGPIVFGQVDADGVEWYLELDQWSGWGTPGSTITVDQRTQDHGGWATPGFLKSRVLAGPVAFVAPDVERAWTALNRLNAAVSLDPTPLTLYEGSTAKTCLVQRQDDVLPKWLNDTAAECSIQLVAPDPRKYGPERQVSTGLPSTSGGLTVPLTVPFSIDATVTTGAAAVVNDGNFEAPGRLVLQGPWPEPRVTALVGGQERTLAWDLDLGAGDWLDVDLGRKTCYQNGTASRVGSMTSRQWWTYPPGATELNVGASAYAPDARLTATYKPAWM